MLSEVKLEVETVIKTGRQIVQKQQTENPKAMDEQLTALKLLYNDLGAQVIVSCHIYCMKKAAHVGWVRDRCSLFYYRTERELLCFCSLSPQVTEGKQDLEKALSLSQKFQKESSALQEWLSKNETQLQQKNGSGDMPADIDAEIAWANVSSYPRTFHYPVTPQERFWVRTTDQTEIHFCEKQNNIENGSIFFKNCGSNKK